MKKLFIFILINFLLSLLSANEIGRFYLKTNDNKQDIDVTEYITAMLQLQTDIGRTKNEILSEHPDATITTVSKGKMIMTSKADEKGGFIGWYYSKNEIISTTFYRIPQFDREKYNTIQSILKMENFFVHKSNFGGIDTYLATSGTVSFLFSDYNTSSSISLTAFNSVGEKVDTLVMSKEQYKNIYPISKAFDLEESTINVFFEANDLLKRYNKNALRFEESFNQRPFFINGIVTKIYRNDNEEYIVELDCSNSSKNLSIVFPKKISEAAKKELLSLSTGSSFIQLVVGRKTWDYVDALTWKTNNGLLSPFPPQ